MEKLEREKITFYLLANTNFQNSHDRNLFWGKKKRLLETLCKAYLLTLIETCRDSYFFV